MLLAEPRGFCAGVEKAIKALAWMVRVFEPPVYCYHEIVHNRHVVDRFVAQGVVFVDDVDEVPPGAPLMLSAHGSAPEVVDAARDDGRVVVDAVCPLVTKVHHELKVRARKGYTVLYVGHHGHEEAVGTMAVAPEAVRLLERVEDVDALDDLDPSDRSDGGAAGPDHPQPRRVGGHRGPGPGPVPRPVDAQPERPVLRHHQPPGRPQGAGRPVRRRRRDRLGELLQHRRPDQGGRRPSAARGCVRVNDASELPDDLSGTVGVTAGASAPEVLVQAVVGPLAPVHGVESSAVTVEEEYFPPPPELRDLLRGLEAALGLLNGAPGGGGRRPTGCWATTGP